MLDLDPTLTKLIIIVSFLVNLLYGITYFNRLYTNPILIKIIIILVIESLFHLKLSIIA